MIMMKMMMMMTMIKKGEKLDNGKRIKTCRCRAAPGKNDLEAKDLEAKKEKTNDAHTTCQKRQKHHKTTKDDLGASNIPGY